MIYLKSSYFTITRSLNLFSFIAILNLLSLVICQADLSKELSEKTDLFLSESRSLSIPRGEDDRAHKCIIEEPAVFSATIKNEMVKGNGTNEHWMKKEVCCNGYKIYEHEKNVCLPDCGRKCINGICVAPNECECFPGYVLNEDGECVNTCPLGCLNGVCHSNGECFCSPGYDVDPTGQFCRPICSSGCGPQRNCTAPDVCGCLKGFEMHAETGRCVPVCKHGCLFGKCIAPDTCLCNTGYIFKDGFCQLPCPMICGNGICEDINHCNCNIGYYYDPTTTTCLPTCSGCENGVCVGVDKCKCFRGFQWYQGKCDHPCGGDCSNGYCDEYDNKCHCFYGKDYDGKCRDRGGVEKS